jgi:hypothetical protein
MGMKLLKSKSDYPRELNITEGRFVSAQTRSRRHLDVEIEKVDNRMRKYYKLTEAGTKET